MHRKAGKTKRTKRSCALRDSLSDSLKGTGAAQSYLSDRGLTTDTITHWKLGYAPNDWRELYDAATGEKVAEATLLDAGLIKKPQDDTKGKKPYDTFRGRIMFPIRDVTGRTVGFSGRLFDEPKGDTTVAKYLNSPETIVFDKSRVLYGLDYARQPIRKYNFAILVEGQFDLLMAHQAGYTNTVALSGTGFTEGHAQLIKRYTNNLVIAFDSDRAGVSAAGRAAQIALPLGLNVKITRLPTDEDPADVINRDLSVWKQSVKEAEHVVDFYLSQLAGAKYDDRTFKLEVSRVVLPYLPLIENEIDRAHFVGRVAQALSVPEEAVMAELKKVQAQTQKPQQQKTQRPTEQHIAQNAQPFVSRLDLMERLVFAVLLSLTEDGNETLAGRVQDDVTDALGKELYTKTHERYTEEPSVVIEGDVFLEQATTEDNRFDVIVELVDDYKREVVHEQYRNAVNDLKQAEGASDDERTSTLLKTVTTLAEKL